MVLEFECLMFLMEFVINVDIFDIKDLLFFVIE